MRKISINRVYPALFLILFPLLLSGCQNGLFGGFKSIFSSEAVTETEDYDKGKPAGEELRPTAQADRIRAQGSSSAKDEDNLLSQLVNLRNPEDLMPLTSSPRSAELGDGESAKGEESASVAGNLSIRNATLTEDTVWRGEVLVEGGVTVAPQATLTVENGTVVRFRGASGSETQAALVVLGRIVVNGTVARPVIFTSSRGQAIHGDWLGIVLTGSGKKNLIENCRVEGAFTGVDASFSTVNMKGAVLSRCRTGARFQDTVAQIEGVEAGECGAGMILYDSEAEIRSANLIGNRLGIYAARTSLSLTHSRFSGNNLLALAAESSRIIISGNSFTANGSGLRLVGCEGSVSANAISKNAAYGILLKESRVRVSSNRIDGNGKAGLRTEDGSGVAWGNAIFANGEFDLYNGGTDEFRAIGNWWGERSSEAIAARIYGRNMDESRGRVLFFPPLQTRPEAVSLP